MELKMKENIQQLPFLRLHGLNQRLQGEKSETPGREYESKNKTKYDLNHCNFIDFAKEKEKESSKEREKEKKAKAKEKEKARAKEKEKAKRKDTGIQLKRNEDDQQKDQIPRDHPQLIKASKG